MAKEYYGRLSEMRPGDLADGLAMEAEFEAIAQAFGKLPTPHTGGQGFEGPVRVGDATNPDEAINKKQLEEAMGTAKQLAVAAYGNFNATAWATLPSGTYLLFGTGSQITNSPFPLAEAKTYYLTVRHAIGDNLYCDSLLMASLDDSAHADIGREAWRSGPTLAVASAGWKAAVFKSGDTVTGDILGVTAPQFANDQKFATTEFVQRALGSFNGYISVNTSRSLAATDIGKALYVGATGITLTLPTPSSLGAPLGVAVDLFTGAFTSATIKPGAGVILNHMGAPAVASISLLRGQSLKLIAVTDTVWQVIASTCGLGFNADFAGELTIGGQQKLPSGWIMKRGSINTSTYPYDLTFPTAFPTACVALIVTGWSAGLGHSGRAQGGARIRFNAGQSETDGFDWVAFGY